MCHEILTPSLADIQPGDDGELEAEEDQDSVSLRASGSPTSVASDYDAERRRPVVDTYEPEPEPEPKSDLVREIVNDDFWSSMKGTGKKGKKGRF